MWLVRLALRRPYTFTIMAMLIVLLGIVTIARMSTDIFPRINIPVVSVIWSFPGVAPEEMAARFVTVTERAMTTTVNDIEHIESQSYSGVAVIKVFFHEGAKAEAGVAQISSICETLLRILPPGTTPPLILQYSASNVPVLQLGLTGEGLSEQQLYDLGLNFIRTQLSTVQGAQVPLPYGGKVRQVMVDIDLQKLYAKGLSPADVTSALTAQNLILPAGTQKIGDREYFVRLNSSPRVLEALNDLPVKQVGNATITMRDVAQVRDGFAVQTNIVSQNGTRAALLTVLKSANASTLDIIKRVREALPRIEATLPPALKITELFDQSLFVRAAIDGVLKEGLIAACLTALMILLFLGSWRSTLIVAVSIPLAIFSSIILLGALGQTLNIMTLGGLALAVGILVDDATVEIENIHRNLSMGKPMTRAILDGAHQVAVPAFVSTLCICIVFVPVFFLGGTAKFLFQPLAMGVIFAMLASYFLSRTVVPTMARFLLRHHLDEIETPDGHKPEGSPENPRRQSHFARVFGWLRGIHDRFNHGFEKLRQAYVAALDRAFDRRGIVFLSMGALVLASLALVPFLGRDFFPAVDAGQFRLHCRAPEGTRLEVTEARFNAVAKVIREVVPADEVRTVLANIGLPASGINLAFSDNSTISSADGEILVALNPDHHGPTANYVRMLRERLQHDFPDMEFSFSAPDIVSQILNFGLPAPIDIQITGANPENLALAKQIEAGVAQIRGAADVHLQQRVHSPELRVNIDRARASQIGLTQQNVANTLLTSLSSSGQASPNFWLNFQNGVNYQVAVQTPQYEMDTLNALLNTPVVAPGLAQPELLGNLVPHRARRLSSHRQPLQRAACVRRARDGPGPRPRRHRGRRREGARQIQPAAALVAPAGRHGGLGRAAGQVPLAADVTLEASARHVHQRAGAGREHEHRLPRSRGRDRVCHRSRLFCDGSEFPVMDRSVRDHFGASWRALRHRLDALHHRNDTERAVPHGGNYGHRRGDGQQHPAGELRQRRTPLGPHEERASCSAIRGSYPLASRADDGAGHDHRNASHVARPGRGGRTERPPGPRGHRRAPGGDLRHAFLCARCLQHAAPWSA